jgi:hypothetical protein
VPKIYCERSEQYCQKTPTAIFGLVRQKPRQKSAKNLSERSELSQKPPPKTFRMNTKLLRQKLAELIIDLTDADLGEVSNIYEAIDTIIAEVTE